MTSRSRRFYCCLVALLAVFLLPQCETLKRFKPESKRQPAGDTVSDDGENSVSSTDEDAEDQPDSGEDKPGDHNEDEEDAEPEKDYRLVAHRTPFFRWLRTGLKGHSKPSRYLEEGTKVEVLKINDEKKFSQVRLPDKKKGWVPSMLIKEKAPKGEEEPNDSEDAEGTSNASTQGQSDSPATDTPQNSSTDTEVEPLTPSDIGNDLDRKIIIPEPHIKKPE